MKQSIAKFAAAGIAGLQTVTGGGGCSAPKKTKKTAKSAKSAKSKKTSGGGCCSCYC